MSVLQVEAVSRYQVWSSNNSPSSQGEKRTAVGVSRVNAFLHWAQQEHHTWVTHHTMSVWWHWAIQISDGIDYLLHEHAVSTYPGHIGVEEQVQSVLESHATGDRACCHPSYMFV